MYFKPKAEPVRRMASEEKPETTEGKH
jgi:hypothetical protein